MFENEADFEKTVSRLNIDNKPNPAHRDKLRREMLSVFDETGQQSATRTTVLETIRIKMMKTMTPKLAAAAVVTIAALVGGHQLLKPDGVNFVYVTEQIRPI